jgi:hypothetical protein
MEWTIQLEMKTGWGDVETVKLARITRPVMAATMADVGLSLTEAKALLARLRETMVRGQVDESARPFTARCSVRRREQTAHEAVAVPTTLHALQRHLQPIELQPARTFTPSNLLAEGFPDPG